MKFIGKDGTEVVIPLEFCPQCWMAIENGDIRFKTRPKLKFKKRLPAKYKEDKVEIWWCSECPHTQYRVVEEWTNTT